MAGIEAHWYQRNWRHLILLPASWLFGALVALRRTLYRCRLLHSFKLPVTVAIIGNISVGGTGKTPLTLKLAQQLTHAGHHPVIISRGFGGNKAQQAVTPESTAEQVGDEPKLMAQRNICPVWVGRDRVATAQAAIQAHPLCDVILCDDGLQHYRLQRDMEIVVIDGVRRFGNSYLLPAGPLREPVSRLASVDAVVINGGKTDPGQYSMQLSGDIFYNLTDPEKTATALDFKKLRVHAIAGIGHPQRYFDHLATLGLTVTPHAFPDHHPYTSGELIYQDCDALLLTEKDAVKCAAFADDKYWVLRVDALIEPALTDQLLRKIAIHGR
ncbi:tetraacyldisaccharide 4'-kinase [Gallionella capsiferriformans]|jgi:tetraacyldisaccharide 4'-kinase|uniref:Tetraacyldisaccharide 4'-kinase n=1 Tax=Gallionella capsiferriformans (strain ES-2) TaxID=395494 RepID=D9SD12_GALCS|nr:tetraacyldisaccharide 4'-kinase [Gallionella capsiferriformans]ADL54701.1 tetraacyldisaccharide 4'-kinase [Gallionella capsiferriformans ES-2]